MAIGRPYATAVYSQNSSLFYRHTADDNQSQNIAWKEKSVPAQFTFFAVDPLPEIFDETAFSVTETVERSPEKFQF